MTFASLRPFISKSLIICFSLIATVAHAAKDELETKLLEAAGRDPQFERQITQIISRIERGDSASVLQSSVQSLFLVAPSGQLSKETLSAWKKRMIAAHRARFLGQYLAFDLDGDGAISKAETEGLFGNDASRLAVLRGTADENGDGKISADELRQAANRQAVQKNVNQPLDYLMAFDLDENGIVVVDEVLEAIRILSDDGPVGSKSQNGIKVTSGTFAETAEQPEEPVENPTNAQGLPIELHMIGIYEPRDGRSNDGLARRAPVPIKVNRPGVSVTLVLGSYVPTRWVIETSEGTQVERVIAADQNRPRGKVILDGKEVSVLHRELPLAHKQRGNRFQPFHEAAAKVAGVRKAASFHGSYTAPEGGFTVDSAPGVPTRSEVEASLRAQAMPASELTPKLRDAFEGKSASPGSKWTLRSEGFVGVDDDGKKILHKLPLDAPEVSWPMGAAYDPSGQRIWGVTLGGEGFLYTYDVAENRWTARSMNNVDAGGLIFDQTTGTLIATPGPHGSSPYMVLDASGKVLSTLDISVTDYPGLIDTYDPGNGPRPLLAPVVIDGDLLMVRAEPRFRPHRTNTPQRVYIVDLQSGKVRLVR